MHLLSVNNISFSWGYKSLLNDLSFSLDRGQTIGIAGPNGAGKSTLIKLIRGEGAPDEGQIVRSPDARLAVVSQEPDFGDARSVGDYLLSDSRPLAERVARLEEALAGSHDEAALNHLLGDFGAAQEAYLQAGGYQADSQARRLLAQTGLEIGFDQALDSLSGGERSVLSILQALVADPDILILDEPGNHLDYLGLAWLECFLAGLDKGILLISHNRYLLDHVAGTILYLEAGRHWLHSGSYSTFRETRREQLAAERKEHAERERQLHQLNIELKDWLHQASQSCNPPPRVMIALATVKKKIARLRAIHDQGLTPVAQGIRIQLQAEESKGDIALQVKNLSLSYGERRVLDGMSFDLRRGDRVALVGLNGSGKSSLIRLIREQANWDNPQLRLAPAMKVGYLSQQSPFVDPARSLVDEVRGWGALSIDGAFGLIAPFAFAYGELEKPVGSLSGGELQRLQLALLTYRKVNFLILDEPSNHLDIPGRETLEACLADFPGTMLIVSHDRYFLDGFARRILHLQDGAVREFEGSFSQFLASQAVARPQAARTRDGGIVARGKFVQAAARERQASPGGASAATGAGPARSPVADAASPLERRIHGLEREIDQAETSILLAMEHDAGLAARLESGLAAKRRELEKLYAEWAGP